MDLTTLIRRGAERFADNPLLICDDRVQTYSDCYQRACRLSQALADLGLKPGDRVATLTDNSPEALELIFGIALGGFVRASLYTHNTPEINAELLTAIGASALIVGQPHHATIAPHLDRVAGLSHVLICDGPAEHRPSGGASNYEDVLGAASTHDPQVDTAPHRPQTIRFSAGTTGRPKAIFHDVAGWTAVGTETARILPAFTPQDRYLAAGPLSHASVMPMPAFVSTGGSIALMRSFDAGAYLTKLSELRCTFSFGVPTMIHAAATHPTVATTDLSSVRCIAYGGSPITAETLRLARAAFGDVLMQIYGQSEGAPLSFLSPADHVAEDGRWLASAGKAVPGSQLLIVDQDGNELPCGEVGEIASRTTTAFAGVWGDGEATKARFLPDGAVLTRDMGYLDEAGFLFLTGRKEDLIISGGFNIWPAELEQALAAHPAVAEAAVVGIPHDRWGETPLALIVPTPGKTVSGAQLVAWTRDKLGPVKKLGALRVGSQLPRSPMGKVLRTEIRNAHIEDPTGTWFSTSTAPEGQE
ncbi:class I adenylate-forming enzyme family protein [Mycobacterium sp. SMC-4]|uniref:class I adenylate-forming enzyme family protein n=1 Tax=Mycobacterium sp. SMC-4 TaxID=2857059 RepID=UPI0021B1AACB|nr:AMP-binding protein [Mycobacterium sp. SMC-4]UXA16551.1 AMP-binding protein [Mycobacterium sp. SMC-4]